jgi:hypothetical protein
MANITQANFAAVPVASGTATDTQFHENTSNTNRYFLDEIGTGGAVQETNFALVSGTSIESIPNVAGTTTYTITDPTVTIGSTATITNPDGTVFQSSVTVTAGGVITFNAFPAGVVGANYTVTFTTDPTPFSDSNFHFVTTRFRPTTSGFTANFSDGQIVFTAGRTSFSATTSNLRGTQGNITWNFNDIRLIATNGAVNGFGCTGTDSTTASDLSTVTLNASNVEFIGLNTGTSWFVNLERLAANSTLSNLSFTQSVLNSAEAGTPLIGFNFDGTIRNVNNARYTLRINGLKNNNTWIPIIQSNFQDNTNYGTGTNVLFQPIRQVSGNEIFLINNRYESANITAHRTAQNTDPTMRECVAWNPTFIDDLTNDVITDAVILGLDDSFVNVYRQPTVALAQTSNPTALTGISRVIAAAGNTAGFWLETGNVVVTQAVVTLDKALNWATDNTYTLATAAPVRYKSYTHLLNSSTANVQPHLVDHDGNVGGVFSFQDGQESELRAQPDPFVGTDTSPDDAPGIGAAIDNFNEAYRQIKREWYNDTVNPDEDFEITVNQGTLTYPAGSTVTIHGQLDSSSYNFNTHTYHTDISPQFSANPDGATITSVAVANNGSDLSGSVGFEGNKNVNFSVTAATINAAGGRLRADTQGSATFTANVINDFNQLNGTDGDFRGIYNVPTINISDFDSANPVMVIDNRITNGEPNTVFSQETTINYPSGNNAPEGDPDRDVLELTLINLPARTASDQVLSYNNLVAGTNVIFRTLPAIVSPVYTRAPKMLTVSGLYAGINFEVYDVTDGTNSRSKAPIFTSSDVTLTAGANGVEFSVHSPLNSNIPSSTVNGFDEITGLTEATQRLLLVNGNREYYVDLQSYDAPQQTVFYQHVAFAQYMDENNVVQDRDVGFYADNTNTASAVDAPIVTTVSLDFELDLNVPADITGSEVNITADYTTTQYDLNTVTDVMRLTIDGGSASDGDLPILGGVLCARAANVRGDADYLRTVFARHNNVGIEAVGVRTANDILNSTGSYRWEPLVFDGRRAVRVRRGHVVINGGATQESVQELYLAVDNQAGTIVPASSDQLGAGYSDITIAAHSIADWCTDLENRNNPFSGDRANRTPTVVAYAVSTAATPADVTGITTEELDERGLTRNNLVNLGLQVPILNEDEDALEVIPNFPGG